MKLFKNKKAILTLVIIIALLSLTGCVQYAKDVDGNIVYNELGARVVSNTINFELNFFEQITENGVWTGIFVYPLSLLIVFLGNIFSNYGVGIILATVVVRGLVWPITQKSQTDMAKMQEVQPKIQKIQEKYRGKSDQQSQQKMQQETMELYKKHNVNPFSSCITPLIQMPILFAFYEAIYRTEVLFSGSFLGLKMGLTPSQATGFALSLEGITNVFTSWNVFYLLFPILAGITTYLSTQITQKNQKKNAEKYPTNNTQSNPMESYMKIMPIMIFVMAFTFPVALSLYWTISNFVTFAQNLYIHKKREVSGN